MNLKPGLFSLHKIIKALCFLGLLGSCVQTPENNRKSKNIPIEAPSKETSGGKPTFPTNLNSLDRGTQSSTTHLLLPTNFSTSIKLRGQEVDNYLRGESLKSTHCLVERYTLGNADSSDDRLLLIAAVPSSTFQTSTNIQEHYFQMVPSLKIINQTQCQKTGLITQLSLLFPAAQFVYDFNDICSGCHESQLQGAGLTMMTVEGTAVTNIRLNYLNINLRPIVESTTVSGNTCSDSSTCQGRGFDCCSLGQCVVNGTLKNNVVNAGNQQSFLNSQIIIATNPARINEFPEFYHLCPITVAPAPIPSAPAGAAEDAAVARLNELAELFSCTEASDGEVGHRTITYKNSSSATQPFVTGLDDRNFTTTYTGSAAIPQHSIVEIIHGGEVLFKNGVTLIPGFTIGPLDNKQGNDSLTDGTNITISHTVRDSSINDDLKITYKIDSSCEEVFSGLAKCYKTYHQGQNSASATDHFPASNAFKIPYYANTSSTVSVEVDGISRSQGQHWQLNAPRDTVEFLGTGLQVLDTQIVKITFFVDTNVNNVLNGITQCRDQISQICGCAGRTCQLTPVTSLQNGLPVITDYQCVYPPPDIPEPPLNQTIALSAKTVPLRYFDNTGAPHALVTNSSPAQEGNQFAYLDGNKLKPNNIDTVIGFNEIYGSLNFAPERPLPAREIPVKKNKTYDIFVNSGSFSSCLTCGNDYYSQLAKLFPRNFLYKGGGYRPDANASNRRLTSLHRSDDSLYGRACWLPATMIPWAHRGHFNGQTQRLRRMAAQHFYFANGYQKDWYGFDYGAIIGSFDGVVWFAVGNERRIQAKSNRLFLAVNGYFGDLTIDETFSITIQEALAIAGSGAINENNFSNDGAECQKFHQCTNDSDCAAQLGRDYTCQSITSITTKWPLFDDNANEIPNSENILRLSALFSATNSGANKRCVYRGKGTPCYANFNNISASNSFAGTEGNAFHACAMSSYCAEFVSGVNNKKFNNKISRYPASVELQNLDPVVADSELTTFGLSARLIGRPFKFNGDAEVDTEVQSNLSNNFVRALCIPGREANNGNISIDDSNKVAPGALFTGDHVLNIGMTMSGVGGAGVGDSYLSLCSILDEDDNYYFHKPANANLLLSNAVLKRQASAQAISTNALDIFQTPTFGLASTSLSKNFTSQVTAPTLEKNRCMRAPGSVCFSDSDCAPNQTIATALAALNPDNYASVLNKYEIQYWQEALICAQKEAPSHADFALKKNRCCRELGKTLTIASLQEGATGATNFDNFNVPAVGIELSDARRYSRIASIKRELDTRADHPRLAYTSDDKCAGGCQPSVILLNQFNTLNTLAQRTCCQGHWVRNFYSAVGTETNHTWKANIGQQIPKESFRCYNWLRCSPSSEGGNSCPEDHVVFGSSGFAEAFTCMHVEAPTGNCLARRVSDPEATAIMQFASSLDLLGIPQVPIKTIDHDFLRCQISTDSNGVLRQRELNNGAGGIVLPGTVNNPDTQAAEYRDSTPRRLYSSMDSNNFSGLSKIFSDETLQCCLPAGKDVPAGTVASECCTGVLNAAKNRCVLPDFTDISLFFNKYVSSASAGLSANLFDSETGFMKSPANVELLACELSICESGRLARGVAHNDLKIKGPNNNAVWEAFRVKRFIDGNDDTNNFSGLVNLYDKGLKWNTNVYCFPPESAGDLPADAVSALNITDCNQAN